MTTTAGNKTPTANATPTTATRALHRLQAAAVLQAHRDHDAHEAGQATAESPLLLPLGAAAIALLVVSWATKTNVVAKLLDAVFGQLLGRTGGAAAGTGALAPAITSR